jgi:PAB-dependent poly(A)-specific ribonuclease subunit 2
MPYYRDTLLSAWPNTVVEVGAPPVKFDPSFLDSLTPADFGLYGHNSRRVRRNQAEKSRKMEKSTASGIQAPKFLSEKARESAKSASGIPASDGQVDDFAADLTSASSSEIPVMYRNVEIKYSKFGVDDFDFGYAVSFILVWRTA